MALTCSTPFSRLSGPSPLVSGSIKHDPAQLHIVDDRLLSQMPLSRSGQNKVSSIYPRMTRHDFAMSHNLSSVGCYPPTTGDNPYCDVGRKSCGRHGLGLLHAENLRWSMLDMQSLSSVQDAMRHSYLRKRSGRPSVINMQALYSVARRWLAVADRYRGTSATVWVPLAAAACTGR